MLEAYRHHAAERAALRGTANVRAVGFIIAAAQND